MSRTDKDTPYWVWAKVWEPTHHIDCEDYTPPFPFSYHRSKKLRACNLPENPVIHYHGYGRWRTKDCIWEPCVKWYSYDVINQKGARWWSAPPKWFVDHRYHNPSRRYTRDSCREAAKEWNTYGDIENDPWYPQAHNSAHWDWY